MFGARLFRLVHDRRLSVPVLRRCFHHEFTTPEPQSGTHNEKKIAQVEPSANQPKIISGAVQQKFKVFRDEDATEIFDVEEERQRSQTEDSSATTYGKEEEDMYYGLNLERGIHGVFDIEDLVDVLRKENAEDIFVCYVPAELKYVDYLVVCSGRSYRHMLAMAEFVRRMFKVKRDKGDILPKIEGEKSRDWMAMDLGNIALHIFAPKAREEFDLESLWAIGSQYDRESNKQQDSYGDIFLQPTNLFEDAKPQSAEK